jgi:hypothetical protein
MLGALEESVKFNTLWMYPGMMPILQASGLMMPGQLGPIRRVLFDMLRAAFTLTMSCSTPASRQRRGHEGILQGSSQTWWRPENTCWGMPSVMQTTRGTSFSMASRQAAPAKGGGT